MFLLIKKLINSKIKHGEHMTKQVFWTKTVVDAFIEEGNLNERQIYIIKTILAHRVCSIFAYGTIT